MNQQHSTVLPEHLAIIMDGNGRWASERGLPRVSGHQRGVQAVIRIVDECARRGISYLTLFAFSSENWGRPQQEVDTLMNLLFEFLNSQRSKMLENGIRLRVIGDQTRLTPPIRELLQEAEEATHAGGCMTLVLALSYGGRDEIVRSMRTLAQQVHSGALLPEQIDDAKVNACLDTGGIPDPDLLIRTSGEQRISNFLLWQLAYAELYFTPVYWPDFDVAELDLALADYQARRRRFGLVLENDSKEEVLSNNVS